MTDIAEPPIDVAVDVRGITRAGEVSCGPGIDQDVAIFFHDNLERYLARGPLDA